MPTPSRGQRSALRDITAVFHSLTHLPPKKESLPLTMPWIFRKGGLPLLAVLASITAAAPRAIAQQSVTEQPDKYTWLEDINGEKQLAWVKSENARTAAVFDKDSRFAPLTVEALKVLDSPDR